MVLFRAADKSVDLIVIGTCGHARCTELGPRRRVTNPRLGRVTVPALMPHWGR